MLSKLDDYPIHQTSRPVAVKASADRNTYDRYWFNGYDASGDFYLGVGAALYPNLGILDGGVSLVIDGEQHAFHCSRRAPKEPTELRVGPFEIDIQEPMKRLKVTVDDNETGFSGELQWIPRTANFAEAHQHSFNGVRGAMEATRFNQFGYWEGELRYDGRTLKIDPKTTYGTKDRSWGVRPVGDATSPKRPFGDHAMWWCWIPLRFDDFSLMFVLEEQPDGFRTINHAIRVRPDGRVDQLGWPEVEIEYAPGTRYPRRARLGLKERGGAALELDIEQLGPMPLSVGLGYGPDDDGCYAIKVTSSAKGAEYLPAGGTPAALTAEAASSSQPRQYARVA